ncbi:glycosyltransferase family 4 protein [Hyphococcus formosus]|uniref:glycosyltransferase family 4 protein n=1 Tax=Hyphococcus formosus TaxID=3143534 RepID=UPI00398ABD4D
MTESAPHTHKQGDDRGNLKLLHVFPSFAFGGQQARLATLIDGLGDGYNHHIITLDGDFSAKAMISDQAQVNFAHFAMKKNSAISFSNIRGLMNAIRTANPDILCTYNWGSIEAVIANRMGPKIPSLHFEDGFGPGETIENQSQKRILGRRFFLRNSWVIVPSHGLEKAAREKWKIKKVTRVENGIENDRFTSTRAPRDFVMIGSVGSLRPEKNYRRLIAAFKKIETSGEKRLAIVGVGPEHDALCEAAGGDNKITFPGQTPAPEKEFAKFDIFALSSDTEQAPISLMEAMAAGLPVVSTNVGDILEMVSNENQPYIMPLGNDDAYCEALATLCSSPALRQKIGEANRKKAARLFSQERMVNQYKEIFSKLLNN